MKKHIVCLGDSNTHGSCADPRDSADGGIRYNEDERWTCRLQKHLGEDYLVLEEGLSGRTTCIDDPIHEGLSALPYLYPCLKSHEDVDLLIIMLGTNDLKHRFSATATDISLALERMVKTAQAVDNYTSDKPFQILLVSPAEVLPKTFLGEVFGDRSGTTKEFPALFQAVAQRCGVHFLNIAAYAQPSELDGLHFDRENHKKVAAAMETKIREILG